MVVKTGIALPDGVYKQLVEISKNMGYTSISRVIRDAVELFIAFNRWWSHSGTVGGTLQLLVPEDNESVASSIHRAVRDYYDIVDSVIAVRLSTGYMLYIMIVHGSGNRVKELYKLFTRIRGVLSLQASLLPIPAANA